MNQSELTVPYKLKHFQTCHIVTRQNNLFTIYLLSNGLLVFLSTQAKVRLCNTNKNKHVSYHKQFQVIISDLSTVVILTDNSKSNSQLITMLQLIYLCYCGNSGKVVTLAMKCLHWSIISAIITNRNPTANYKPDPTQ